MSGQSAVNLTSITGSYTDLRLVIFGSVSSAGNTFGIQFNNDTGANYYYQWMYAVNGGVPTTTNTQGDTSIPITVNSSNATAPIFYVLDIMSYANTNVYRTMQSRTSQNRNDTSNASGLIVAQYFVTNAITTINIMRRSGSGTWSSNATASLYGILRA